MTAITLGAGRGIGQSTPDAFPPEDGEALAAADVERILKQLGFFGGTLSTLTSLPEWDAETTRAFDAWATDRGLTYSLTPDPDPPFPEAPDVYMIVSPLEVVRQLEQEFEGHAEGPVTVTVTRTDEQGVVHLEEETKVTAQQSRAGLAVWTILGGVGLFGVVYFIAETRTVVSGLGRHRRHRRRRR